MRELVIEETKKELLKFPLAFLLLFFLSGQVVLQLSLSPGATQ